MSSTRSCRRPPIVVQHTHRPSPVFLVDNDAVVRTLPPACPRPFAGPSTAIQRCVVVAKESDGYGLTVTGDHPVFVHTLKPDGAAFRAGVREGDRIVKVNGMPVTKSNHLEVVRMISGGQNVALTLLGRPPDSIEDSSVVLGGVEQRPLITNPVPLSDAREKEEWRRRRVEVIRRMLDEEKRNVKEMWQRGTTGKELEQAERRVSSLEHQLRQIDGGPLCPFERPSQTIDIRPMESESDDDLETSLPVDTQGPFADFSELRLRSAHLAVFLNFLLTNANPNSVFFYMISQLYEQNTGAVKELRRWAYEIFSTFLMPQSPCPVPGIESAVWQSIDKMLAQASGDGDVEMLRKLFEVARRIALEDIKENLVDFRQKRQLGLGSLFGTERLKDLDNHLHIDRAMELKHAEQILLPLLEQQMSGMDVETLEAHSLARCSALATIIKLVLGIRSSCNAWEKLLDKCPTFVTKEKSSVFKMKPISSKRSVQIKGHHFLLAPVLNTVNCYQCEGVVWGVQAQAYFCSNCDVVLHRQCTSTLTDHCYPASQSNKIRQSTKIKQRSTKTETDMGDDSDKAGGDEIHRDDSPKKEQQSVHIKSTSSDSPKKEQQSVHIKSTSSDSGIAELAEKSVSRTQSLRSRSDDLRDSRRGRTALSWGGGTPLPPSEEVEETVRRPLDNETTTWLHPPLIDAISVSGSSSISGRSLGEEETRKMLERVEACVVADGDSDLELESEIPSIESFISWDVIRHLQPKEKRRQEVINELFYTERTHVRNLKILYRVFYTPLLVQQIVPPDVVKLLFSNIDEIVDIHCQISRFMRTAAVRWRNAASTNGLYGDIGDVMLSIFDGAMGHRLSEATSQFCQHQQYALEVLRLRCKKDESLVRFLAEVETNVLCRKLQLKDMLPVEMQRLVKYPILLETIGKYTADPSEEQTKIAVCVQHAKAILSSVNIAKRNTENLRRLQDLQRRLDTTSFDRDNANSPDYRGLDLTRYHLIHEGPLTWRFNRGKMVELHVVLLEQMLVLLTRQGGDGQRLQLRVQEPSKEVRWSPILPLGPLIAKEKANDRKAFFIVSNVAHGAQIYEFVAATATERKTWYKLISDQIDIVHRKAGGNSTASMSELGLPSDLTAGSLRHVASAPNCEDPTALGGEEQRVQVLTHPRLVNADEIRVLQPTILEHAQPILTPPERLRRADHLISTALLEKQTILASFLPPDLQAIHMADLDQLAEQLIGLSLAELKQKDSRELIVATIVHGNRLLDAINQAMNNREVSGESLPSVPCYRLTGIAAPLMNHLKAVMQVVQDQHGQMNEMRQQLHHYKELVDTGSSSIRSVSEETLTDTGQQRGSQQGMVNTGQQQGSQQAMVNTGQQRASQQAMENEEEQRRKQRLQQKRARNSVRVLGAGDDNPS